MAKETAANNTSSTTLSTRQIFEKLLASKHHCSPALNAAGRDFLKEVDKTWTLAERYCENFAENDWRIVLRRGHETFEFSVDRTTYDAFGG